MKNIETIYRRYANDIFMYLRGLGATREEAQDLTSETFVRAIEQAHLFEGRAHVRTWLFRIAKNQYIDRYRAQQIRMRHVRFENDSVASDTEQQVLERQDARRIQEQMSTLGEVQRRIFYLRVIGELSFERIGSLYGKSANWACVNYHRAKQKIQEAMQEDE